MDAIMLAVERVCAELAGRAHPPSARGRDRVPRPVPPEDRWGCPAAGRSNPARALAPALTRTRMPVYRVRWMVAVA